MIEVHQDKSGYWVWVASVDLEGEPIAKSNTSFFSREEAFNNLLLLNQMITNMVGRAAQQHFAAETMVSQGQLPPNQEEKKP